MEKYKNCISLKCSTRDLISILNLIRYTNLNQMADIIGAEMKLNICLDSLDGKLSVQEFSITDRISV